MTKEKSSAAPLDALEERLGHRFTRPDLLQRAMEHPSLLGGKKKSKSGPSPYERLEFLGDRVLGLIIAEWLYELFPNANEGELAKRHAAMVNREPLRIIALKIELERFLHRAGGEDVASDAHRNVATLSDATEAVIGALYLDSGLESAKAFIRREWQEMITEASAANPDPKSGLQEWAQGRGLPLPTYTVIGKSGPAHAPLFRIEARVEGHDPVIAEGLSKREAEKLAASTLLNELHKQDKIK